MATIDFNLWRDPTVLILPPYSGRGPRRKTASHRVTRLVERYKLENSEEQEKWLKHIQHILRDTFPFLKVSRDITNIPIPQNIETILTRTCFYRGGVIPGLVYKFNFTLPSVSALSSELLLHMPFDYRIKNPLYVQTAGRFDLELFRYVEAPMYYI